MVGLQKVNISHAIRAMDGLKKSRGLLYNKPPKLNKNTEKSGELSRYVCCKNYLSTNKVWKSIKL